MRWNRVRVVDPVSSAAMYHFVYSESGLPAWKIDTAARALVIPGGPGRILPPWEIQVSRQGKTWKRVLGSSDYRADAPVQ